MTASEMMCRSNLCCIRESFAQLPPNGASAGDCHDISSFLSLDHEVVVDTQYVKLDYIVRHIRSITSQLLFQSLHERLNVSAV